MLYLSSTRTRQKKLLSKYNSFSSCKSWYALEVAVIEVGYYRFGWSCLFIEIILCLVFDPVLNGNIFTTVKNLTLSSSSWRTNMTMICQKLLKEEWLMKTMTEWIRNWKDEWDSNFKPKITIQIITHHLWCCSMGFISSRIINSHSSESFARIHLQSWFYGFGWYHWEQTTKKNGEIFIGNGLFNPTFSGGAHGKFHKHNSF